MSACVSCGAELRRDATYCVSCGASQRVREDVGGVPSTDAPPEGDVEALRQLYEVVTDNLSRGVSKKDIVKELVKTGANKENATTFVDNVEAEFGQAVEEYKRTDEGRREMASQHARHMRNGLLWIVGGAAVTGCTYAAAEGGGTYFITWGAMAWGAIDFLRGLIGWIQYHD